MSWQGSAIDFGVMPYLLAGALFAVCGGAWLLFWTLLRHLGWIEP